MARRQQACVGSAHLYRILPLVEPLGARLARPAARAGPPCRLRVIIVTREAPEAVAERLAPYVSEFTGVGFDPSGQNYSAFEVDYVPFGVLTNARNRVLWLGNTLQLTPEDIDRNL